MNEQEKSDKESGQQNEPGRNYPVDAQLVSKLEKLFELKTTGVLSDVEFQEQKRKLILRS